MRCKQKKSRGAVTVEFALMAPIFLTMVMGVTEASRLFDVQNQMNSAAREGARLAAMDRTGLSGAGTGVSTNTKVINDVKNILKATGLDPANINISIVDHNDPSQAFNLDDPANSLKYFEVKISVPYSATTSSVPTGMETFSLKSKVVFRNIKLAAEGT